MGCPGGICIDIKIERMEQLNIIKIGGTIIDSIESLNDFLAEFSGLDGLKVLIHGGGRKATEIGGRLGIKSNYFDGRRITDQVTLEVVTMVYGGLINKQLVATLQSFGCNAIGLCGADANLLAATKRPVNEVDYGFVGDVKEQGVNSEMMKKILGLGLVPVIAPLTHDGNGLILNTNADTIAQEIGKALAKHYNVQIIYCFEKNGVLRFKDDEGSVIRRIEAADFQTLKAGKVISDGMLPKLENALKAVESGVQTVTIGKASNLLALIKAEAGTQISKAYL
jgi:acetylglutamate kinase